jgi:hypothetical protein
LSHDQMLQDVPPLPSKSALALGDTVGMRSGAEMARVEVTCHTEEALFSEPSQPLEPEGTVAGHASNTTQHETKEKHSPGLKSNAVPTKKQLPKNLTRHASKTGALIDTKKSNLRKSQRRKASASQDQSVTTLKSALKVSKPPVPRLGASTGNKTTTWSMEQEQDRRFEELSTGHSVEGDSKHFQLPLPRTSLKPSLQPTRSALNNSASSSNKQDAQPQKQPFAVEDDDFDLDGAMDDLGSYLDTWDVEKQAAGISR